MQSPTEPEAGAPHSQIAFNYATDSENRMHSDEGARPFGFRGGLVPGIGDYAYLVPPVLRALGSEWALHGWMEVKLLKPVYDGDEVEARAAWAGDEHEEVTLELFGEGGVLCAKGAAGIAIEEESELSALPEAVLPPEEERPPASLEALSQGSVLGSLTIVLDEATLRAEWRRQFGSAGEWPQDAPPPHPAFYPDLGNRILSSNVLLGPWIHTQSRTRHLQAPSWGEEITVRGVVRQAFERRGHEIVELDVDFVGADGRTLARLDHRAIIRPRRR